MNRIKVEYEGKIYWVIADTYEEAMAKVEEWYYAED